MQLKNLLVQAHASERGRELLKFPSFSLWARPFVTQIISAHCPQPFGASPDPGQMNGIKAKMWDGMKGCHLMVAMAERRVAKGCTDQGLLETLQVCTQGHTEAELPSPAVSRHMDPEQVACADPGHPGLPAASELLVESMRFADSHMWQR